MKNRLRIWLGVALGVGFMYLALRKIRLDDLINGFSNARYWPLLPCGVMVILSHILRAIRWQLLILPVKKAALSRLFSALMIGYVVNSFTPAHLGELVRSYVLGKKEGIQVSSVLASVVVERVIDIFSLLALMLIAVFLYPFPSWVTKSGYLMLAVSVVMLLVLVTLRLYPGPSLRYIAWASRFLPGRLGGRLSEVGEGFISGLVPLAKWSDYIKVGVLSVAIWLCYGVVFHLCLFAFDFNTIYGTTWLTSVLLLVITTIAVVVPSSPGYVGTYHYLCQLTLAMFAVPAGQALSFAAVVHMINFLPVTLVGIFCAKREGMTVLKNPAGTEKTSGGKADY